jgi:signal transduction histidine kinase
MSDEIYLERASASGGVAEASLEELLTFERLLADLSARFANASIVQVETEIDNALNHLQEFLGFDRSNFYEFSADGGATILGSAARAGVERLPLGPAPAFFLGYRGVASHITAAVRAARLEEALQEAKVVGDNIAHDLRTPLTRVRIRLERGREHASTLEEFRAVADQAIAGLDQSLTTITALLRIAEIEHSRRHEGFSEVQLAPLIREVGDLYDPIAEDKSVILQIEATHGATVHGDRDLLFEAVTNLVDNAVKFTPEGGRVELVLLYQEGETIIRVSDTGPGIPEIEREAVTQRFYRSDQTRNAKGVGLGLSMVAAIVKLHGFRFTLAAGPGCTAEIACLSH